MKKKLKYFTIFDKNQQNNLTLYVVSGLRILLQNK